MLLATVLIVCATSIGMHASFTLLAKRINLKLPPEKRMYYFDVGPWKILREYRETYPESRLCLLPWLFMGAGLLCWIGVVWEMFFLA